MIRIKYAAFLALAAATTFSSCRKKPVENPPVDPVAGSMRMELTNQMEGVTLDLSNTWYKNAAGDSFKVDVLKYYISNISFTTADGKTYTEPESYHLINQADPASRRMTFSNVPADTYTSVKFMIGVDSLRNVSGAQTGALDPSNGMFWTWNSGYIMAKMEGTSPQSGDPAKAVTIHVGGFSGANQVLRWVTLPLNGGGAKVDGNKAAPNVHVTANLAEWFRTPNPIDFATVYHVMMGGKNARMVADNYADMFAVDHID